MRGLLLLVATLGCVGCSNLFNLQPVTFDSDAGVDDAALVDAPDDGVLADAPTDASTDAPADAMPPPMCPASYGTVGGRRLKVYTAVDVTWSVAQQTCLNDRGNATNHTHLAVMASETERSEIGSLLQIPFWVGLTDRATLNTWIWVTNETTAYPGMFGWAMLEPSMDPGEDCALALGNDSFDAVSCLTTAAFICECDAFANQPANYQM